MGLNSSNNDCFFIGTYTPTSRTYTSSFLENSYVTIYRYFYHEFLFYFLFRVNFKLIWLSISFDGLTIFLISAFCSLLHFSLLSFSFSFSLSLCRWYGTLRHSDRGGRARRINVTWIILMYGHGYGDEQLETSEKRLWEKKRREGKSRVVRGRVGRSRGDVMGVFQGEKYHSGDKRWHEVRGGVTWWEVD